VVKNGRRFASSGVGSTSGRLIHKRCCTYSRRTTCINNSDSVCRHPNRRRETVEDGPENRNAIVVVIALIAIAAVVFVFSRKRRGLRLKEHFGPEYERTLKMRGDANKAEAELLNREKPVQGFSIRAPPPAARTRYIEEWSAVQRLFVDDPAVAVTEADSLVNRVMTDRGFGAANDDW
jgi:hypothetical protein